MASPHSVTTRDSKEHVAELRTAAADHQFGPISETLIDLLVDVALGSPVERALRRVAPDLDWNNPQLLKAAPL